MTVLECARNETMKTSEHISYTIFSPGKDPETIENYLLLSIDGIGFLVIKHVLNLREV